MKDFYNKISSILEDTVKKEFSLTLPHPLWELSPRREFGDLSSMAALKLASLLKKDPLEIATQLKVSLKKRISDIDKIEILKPGFINIFVNQDLLLDSLNKILREKEVFFQRDIGKKILIEFLSANPTGPLSVAHGRQAVVGDVISNILKFFGNKVEREYYLNDQGRQIDLLVSSVEARIKEIKKENFSFPKDGYQADYIKEIARKFLQNKGKNLKKFALNYSISLIKRDLKELGIEFNNWFSQKKIIDDKKVEAVIEMLRAKDLVYEQQGALWFASTKFGDDKDRVVRKADGELTYFACDIAYHKDKLDRRYAELINLWGPDHHGYIKRVKTAIGALGCKKEILKIIIIQLVTLKTKERMSKRAGTFVLFSQLIKNVGKDATRFYYLTRKNSSHLEFDIDLAKKVSFDNPLYYIQYASARIESIFRKVKPLAFNSKFSKLLSQEKELNLLRMLLEFNYYLDKAYYSLEPVFIIEFLKSLASSFHKFYEEVRVIDQDKNITKARLNLLLGIQVALHCGLGLLGIKPAKRM